MDKFNGIVGKAKELTTKNNVFKYIVTHYIICIVLAFIYFQYSEKKHTETTTSLKKAIIAKDSLVQEKEGQYKKMVNYYNTEKQLNNRLASSNKALHKTINDQNETLLMLTNASISFKPDASNKPSVIVPISNSPDSLKFNAFYPNEKDFLVRHYGTISTKTNNMYNNWEFGKIDLDITVSEDANGLWNTRIGGPDYLVVKKLTVNSQPPKNFVPKTEKPKNLSFLLGGGATYDLNEKKYGVKAGAGFEIKNKLIFLGEINNKATVGLGIYKRF